MGSSREPRGLWRTQGLAADVARGVRRCAMHGRTPDGRPRPARCHSGQAPPHDCSGQGRAVSAGPCQPGVPCAGAEYVSIRYTERLGEAGSESSVGSVGDSYDNALAETINGLYKAELIHRSEPWRSFEAVEFATPTWVDWLNNRRLLGAHRQHSAGRSRRTLLRDAGRASHRGVTQTKRPPTNPGRFSLPAQHRP